MNIFHFQTTDNILKIPKAQAVILNFFLLWTKPGENFYFNQLKKLLKLNPKSLNNELNYLVEKNVLTSFRRGNSRFFSVNKNHPFIDAYKQIANLNVIIVDRIKKEFSKQTDIKYSFIFGSFTTSIWTKNQDIDIACVGTIPYDVLLLIVTSLQRELAIDIEFILYTEEEFKAKLAGKNNLLVDILSKDKARIHPLISLKGNVKKFFTNFA